MANSVREFVIESLKGFYERLPLKKVAVNGSVLTPDASGVVNVSVRGDMTYITYAELKNLRDTGSLVPGMQYRITDYHCSTTQQDTSTADNQFDIIVTADSSAVLNENVRAAKHTDSSTDYFAKCNLEAWELKYCLDNDKERFAWAQNRISYPASDISVLKVAYDDLPNALKSLIISEAYDYDSDDCGFYENGVYANQYKGYGFSHDGGASISDDYFVLLDPDENYSIDSIITFMYTIDAGRNWNESNVSIISINGDNVKEGTGVVYYMKDEWNNECPYDFKNIMFRRWEITSCPKCPSLVVDDAHNYCGFYYGAKLNGDDVIQNFDASYGSANGYFYTFALKDLASEDWFDYTVVAHLGLKNDEGNEMTCYNNHISNFTNEYISGNGYVAKILNNIVFFNTYSDLSDTSYAEQFSYCYSNSFGNDCYSNTFGNSCHSNSFGNNCYSNTFGNDCFPNSFRNNCNSNFFGNSCRYTSFGNGCNSNSFGYSCWYNSFGNGCYSNSFGDGCYSNSFGNNCCSNTFGNECHSNSFRDTCCYIKFGNFSSVKSYYKYIIVENGNRSIYLDTTQTTSSVKRIQNIKIAQGVNNTTVQKTITHNTVNDTFQTVYQPANSNVIEI